MRIAAGLINQLRDPRYLGFGGFGHKKYLVSWIFSQLLDNMPILSREVVVQKEESHNFIKLDFLVGVHEMWAKTNRWIIPSIYSYMMANMIGKPPEYFNGTLQILIANAFIFRSSPMIDIKSRFF
jgi:hypothetical protein